MVDWFFLALYVVELGLRCAYKQRELLFGSLPDIWENWIDVFIVVFGSSGQCEQPVLSHSRKHSSMISNVMRCLRLVRHARLVQVVTVCVRADVTWARYPAFQGFMMCVISLNAVVMRLETEWPSRPVWLWLDQAILSIFVFELLARLKMDGRTFHLPFSVSNKVIRALDEDQHVRTPSRWDWLWGWLDFFIFVGGCVDQLLIPCVNLAADALELGPPSSGQLGQWMMLLGTFRLFCFLRLVRLIKGSPDHLNLVKGVADAFKGMGWVLSALRLEVTCPSSVRCG